MLWLTQGPQQLLPHGGCELSDETQRGDNGEEQVVCQYDVEVSQPVEPPKVSKQVEACDSCPKQVTVA